MASKEVETRIEKVVGENPLSDEAAFAALHEVASLALTASPLMTGKKYETDELLTAHAVMLKDVDTVDYTAGDEAVHFGVFRVVPLDKQMKPCNEEGYYNGGAVLTKLADNIISANMAEAMRVHGLIVKLEKKKTSGGNTLTNVILV